MATANTRALMSVAELAQLLNVSRGYVVRRLLHKHVLRPVVVVCGQRHVLHAKAMACSRKRKRFVRRALRELACVSQEAALYRQALNVDMNDLYAYHADPSVLTTVSVFLGDCSGDSLPLVCEGTATHFDATTWRHVDLALQHPSPRGPYPVSSVFTIFVHNTSLVDNRVLSTIRVDVVCKNGLAYASVQSSQPRFDDLEPVPVVIGDDVVTVARKIVASAQ